LSRRLYTEQPTRRGGNRHPETYPVDSFATRDGDIVLVGFSDGIVKRIFEAIGRPELHDDPRFKSNRDRNLNENELHAIISGWAGSLSQAEALKRLRDADVPVAPVWSIDDLLKSGHVEARNLLQPGTNMKLGDIRLVSQPVRFSEAAPIAPMRSPVLGEDTDAVLSKELGLDPARISALRAAKAI
jgi:CoA:oxalate CoA-transferase